MRPPRRPILLACALVTTILATPAAAGTPDPAVPRFADVTKASGIRQVYDGEWEYFVGGGVAAFDCTDDGKPELYIAGGVNPAGLWRNESTPQRGIRFSRSEDPVTDLTEVTGAYPLDIDSDGQTDLAVLRRGESQLLRGLGDCAFERGDDAWGVDLTDAWTTAFSATWEGDAVLPTLAFGGYINLGSDDLFGDCADHALLRPRPDGSGYGSSIALTPGFCTLSMLFSDWGRTGQRDLRISNDRHFAVDGTEQLWRMTSGEPPALYAAEDGWQELRIWGMGIASQDLTGDGMPEVYLTSMGDNRLQTLVPGSEGPTYDDIAFESGVTATQPYAGGQSLPSTAWHAQFEDVNNDGIPDLYVAKGNVEAIESYASKDPSNLFIGQPDGTFVEGAPEAKLVDFDRTRGAALVDLDLDGLLDLVEVNRRENVSIHRNVGAGTPRKPAPMGGFVALRLHQGGPNPDAIGSWIEVRTGDRTQTRELTVGGGHASGQLGWTHLGLGEATDAEVRVQWPDGEWGPWLPVTAGTFSLVERGADAVTPWSPPA